MIKTKDNSFEIFIKAFLGGVCIAIGCNIYLACSNKIVGAFLFSIGLVTILLFGFNLFTGKIGYLFRGETLKDVGLILVGNAIGCIFVGLMCPNKAAEELVTAKLDTNWLLLLPKAFLCGVLMYIAVEAYRRYKKVFPAILCVAVFILSGYEHSIADIGYFIMAREFSPQSIWFIAIVIIGNSLGGLFIPLCKGIISTTNLSY